MFIVIWEKELRNKIEWTWTTAKIVRSTWCRNCVHKIIKDFSQLSGIISNLSQNVDQFVA